MTAIGWTLELGGEAETRREVMAKSRPRRSLSTVLISPVNDNRAPPSAAKSSREGRINFLKEASIRNMVLFVNHEFPTLFARQTHGGGFLVLFCLFFFCFFVFLCLCLCWDQIWRLKQDGQLLYH